jgi:hypothetical protein
MAAVTPLECQLVSWDLTLTCVILLSVLSVLLAPPAALSSALPADSKKPLGVDILGSRITLFRDENGKVSKK